MTNNLYAKNKNGRVHGCRYATELDKLIGRPGPGSSTSYVIFSPDEAAAIVARSICSLSLSLSHLRSSRPTSPDRGAL